MAPPTNRRTGSSRRAQYTTFFGYVAGGVGAAIGAILLFASISNPGFLSGLRHVGAEASAPVSRAAASGKAQGGSLAETISGYWAAGSQNAQLKRELAEAKARLLQLQAQQVENQRLKSLLGLMREEPRPVVATRMIGSTSASTRRIATIDAGHSDGVSPGMPVRSASGVLGRVLDVSRTTARVLLVTDSESVVPIRRARDGLPGFAQGRGDGSLDIRLINLGINPLKPGDQFVTSGSGGLYRPGIPIAVVWKTTSEGAIARVLGDPAGNDYVIVDQVWVARPETMPGDAGATPAPSGQAQAAGL